ncbi:hypothetical protein B0188_01050 [[Haemophilus] felis]|uniref:DUF305 domain-containing protein n=1 Tax=[Haemophilus] felis TaxID=123822 RepID=A0A1T0BAQ3_9PAST|nr:hypothetical protein B0188_01050 [[Haemophilus] felis]
MMNKMGDEMSKAGNLADADTAFAKGMIPHHIGAVEMAKVQLEFGKDETMRKLAQAISQWLQAFEKQGINGLFPKPKGRPAMKPKYPKMPPSPKTEEERLRYRILELEAENAYLKKLRELNQAKMRKK